MELRELKGTKEYLPEEQIIREEIKNVLTRNFQKYGYKPIETSILESYDIAASKYAGGDEILKETYTLSDQGKRKLVLRYELTFKLAKLIGLNPSIRLPLKRYEIGKVFRDGPVKSGRLREFTQCDVDIVGVKSVIAEAELMPLVFDSFNDLKLDVYVQLNNRKLLFGLFEFCNIEENKFVDFALSLDKLEKYGEKAVKKELDEKRFDEFSVNKIFDILEKTKKEKTNNDKLNFLETILTNDLSKEGLSELKDFFNYLKFFNVKEDVIFMPTLARGLGYYNGLMYEVYLKNSKITSSITAGGRWDNIIPGFLETDKEYPATGISFGLETIYAALQEKGFNSINMSTTQIYIIPINTLDNCLEIATELRNNKINVDIAFNKKLSKALDYANKESVPYVLIVGEKELDSNKFKLKNMTSGKEEELNLDEIIEKLK